MEEQTNGIFKKQEAGMKTADVCRLRSISEGTYYKSKCGGMGVSDARELKVLKDENTNLKKLLA